MSSTPLPPSTIGAGALYHPSQAITDSRKCPQPRTSPVAHFSSLFNDGVGNDSVSNVCGAVPTSGRLLAVNSHYIAYAVKKGLVRVIDRRTASKTLLRGHGERTRIVDAAFFGGESSSQEKEGVAALWKELSEQRRGQNAGSNSNSNSSSNGFNNLPPISPDASDILATVGGMKDEACVLIWRIHGGGGSSSSDMGAEKLLELRFPPAARIIWHPFNPNRFLLLHRNINNNNNNNNADGNGSGDGKKYRSVATMVDTTRLVTQPHHAGGHTVCECRPPASGETLSTEDANFKFPGAAQFFVAEENGVSLAGANDVAWSSKDAKHVLTAHDDGKVRLWDVSLPEADITVGGGANSLMSVPCVAELDVASAIASVNAHNEKRVTRVLFLPRYECEDIQGKSFSSITPPFITGTEMNHTITLWSSFTVSSSDPTKVCPPERLRTFSLRHDSHPSPPPTLSSLLSVEMCPAPYCPTSGEEVVAPSSFLLLAERTSGYMHALHLDTEWNTVKDAPSSVIVKGFDYVTTLNVVHPAYSYCVAPTTSDGMGGGDVASLGEERDVDLCCVQSKAVQMLTLSAAMCAGPRDKGSKDGELAPGVSLMHLPDVEDANEEEFEEEEYDMEDEDMQADVEYNGDDDNYEEEAASFPLSAPVQKQEPLSANFGGESNDPFSNWLGAIANPLPPPTASTVSSTASAPPPGLGFAFSNNTALPPPPGMGAASTTTASTASQGMTFLSPMQILSGGSSVRSNSPKVEQTAQKGDKNNAPSSASASTTVAKKSVRGNSPMGIPPSSTIKGSSTAGKKKKGSDTSSGNSKKPPATSAPLTILRREEPSKVEDASSNIIPVETASSPTPQVVGPNVDLSTIEATIERALAGHMKSHEKEMIAVVHKALTSEVGSIVRSSLKEIEKSNEQSLERAFASDGKFGRKLEKVSKESAALAAKQAVAGMEAPIVASLHQTMKEIMIPAYEAATRQMFQQVSTSVEQGLTQISINQANASAPAFEAMSRQMLQMSEAIQNLSTEVAQLRAAGVSAGTGNGQGPSPPTQQPQPMDIWKEIGFLCQAQRFEEAFTKAVSASDGDVALFACKSADSSAVFNGEVALSQPILLCLMQQLGAVLVSTANPDDFKTVLAWLQEIAVTIDPTNENIQRHVASVVQQLVLHINNKMANCDPVFRRPLQTLMQVIRGLL